MGNYSYHASKKRAVIQAGTTSYGYDANGNMTSRAGSTIGYTSYNLPGVIYAGSNSSTLSYGAYRNRYKQVAVTAGVSETTIYVGGILEKVTKSGTTTWRHRIEGPGGLLAIVNCTGSSCDPTASTNYVHRDTLGSPDLITNSAGTEVVKLSFGAFGERRDRDWHGAVSSADMAAIGNSTRRGFTEHEHLDAVGLIHMNGRVYDPVLGRFLASDPVADGLGRAGGFNRYAYVGNNPLTLVDPSGLSSKETRLPQHDAGRLGSLVEHFTHEPPHDPRIGPIDVWATRIVERSWYGFGSGGAFGGSVEAPFSNRAQGRPNGGSEPSPEQPKPDPKEGAEKEAPAQKDDPADEICRAPGQGGDGRTLRQRAKMARGQALGGALAGFLLGRVPGAALGYGVAVAHNAYGLRAGGALVQGGSQQGNRAYGAVSAGLGIPLTAAQMFAGFYEQYGPDSGGSYDPKNGTFLTGPPYGDDPNAQRAIAEGYACGR